MQTPSPDELRAASEVIDKRFPSGGSEDAKLEARAEAAATLVSTLTFRTIEPIVESTIEGYAFEEVPAQLKAIAVRAVALMVNHELVTGDVAFAEELATGRLKRGFTAGPYSESYFAPGEFARRGAEQQRPAMDPDEQLDAALWALATEDAREYFVETATGVRAPASAITTFDYTRQATGDRPGGIRGGPF